jgi:hypothetical protein
MYYINVFLITVFINLYAHALPIYIYFNSFYLLFPPAKLPIFLLLRNFL